MGKHRQNLRLPRQVVLGQTGACACVPVCMYTSGAERPPVSLLSIGCSCGHLAADYQSYHSTNSDPPQPHLPSAAVWTHTWPPLHPVSATLSPSPFVEGRYRLKGSDASDGPKYMDCQTHTTGRSPHAPGAVPSQARRSLPPWGVGTKITQNDACIPLTPLLHGKESHKKVPSNGLPTRDVGLHGEEGAG